MRRAGCGFLLMCVLATIVVTIGASPLVAAPTNLTASVNGDTVTLQWTDVTPVTSHIVEVGSFAGSSDLAIFDTQSGATSVVVTQVPPRNYWVRVRARTRSEISEPSNEVHVRVDGGNCAATLYAPYGWRTSGRESAVTLSWEAAIIGCPATEYVIEVGSTPGATNLANYHTGNSATSYTATNVPPGTYYVRLRSANDLGVSFPTEERIVVIGSGPCIYSVGPSSVSISRGGLNGFINIHTDPSCSWTMTTDAPWLLAPVGPLPLSGTGNGSTLLVVNPNLGAPRTATIAVRWPGGGADVPVFQNGFGL